MRGTWFSVSLAALFVAQFLHGLAPPPEDAPDTGSIVGPVAGLGFLMATAVALWWVRRNDPRGPRLALVIGLAIPIGFVLYHGAWLDTPVTNPYWGDGSATGVQWATLAPVIATSIWVTWLARPTTATTTTTASASTT